MQGRAGRVAAFTLVEVVVATALLAIAILGTMATLQQGQHLNAFSRERALALDAADRAMAEVLATDWDGLLARNEETFAVVLGGAALVPAAGRTEPGRIAVAETARADLRSVEVSVRWTSVIGSEGYVVLRTLVARH